MSGWTTETLDSLKEDAKEKHIFVAETEGVIVGSVRFWTVAGVWIIPLLSVSPSHQGHGVGKALIREIERVATDAHKYFACTMLRTARNIHLFMSLCYKAETILPDHYDHLDLICFKYQVTVPKEQHAALYAIKLLHAPSKLASFNLWGWGLTDLPRRAFFSALPPIASQSFPETCH